MNGGFTFEHFDFNFKNPILQDKAVRQAFALCIDRQEIVDTLIKPLGTGRRGPEQPHVLPVPVGLQGQRRRLYDKQDIAKAKSTLEAAGWTLGSDGIYEKGGQKLAFRIGRRDPNPRRQKTIELVIAAVQGGRLRHQGAGRRRSSTRTCCRPGDFDVALFAWAGTRSCRANTVDLRPAGPGGGQNYGYCVNPRRQGDCSTQANAEFDEAKRADLLQPDRQGDLGRHGHHPAVPVPRARRRTSKNVENVIYNPSHRASPGTPRTGSSPA